MNTFETYEQIQRNPYLKDLIKVAQDYGMYGCFREIHNNPDQTLNGIYFLYGNNQHMINSPNTDIRQAYNISARDKLFFHFDCIVHKITGQPDLATHNEIVNNLRHCEFIYRLQEEYKVTLPGKITSKNLILLRNEYNRMLQNRANYTLRTSSYTKIKYMLLNELKYHNPKTNEYHQLQYYNRGYYDAERGRLYNWFRRHFFKHKNCVSLAHLSNSSVDGVQKYVINVNYARALKKELSKHPEILYHISRPFGNKVNSEIDNAPWLHHHDMRIVRLTYDRAYDREIDSIVYKVLYPEANQTTVADMLKRYGACTSIGIAVTDYDNFVSLCKTNHVEFCIDSTYSTQSLHALNMVVPAKDNQMLMSICNRIANEAEAMHIVTRNTNNQLTSPSANTQNQTQSLQALLDELPSDNNSKIVVLRDQITR